MAGREFEGDIPDYEAKFDRLGMPYIKGRFYRRNEDDSITAISSYQLSFDSLSLEEVSFVGQFLVQAAQTRIQLAFSPLIIYDGSLVFMHWGFERPFVGPLSESEAADPAVHRDEFERIAGSFKQSISVRQNNDGSERITTSYERGINIQHKQDTALLTQLQMRAAEAGIYEAAVPKIIPIQGSISLFRFTYDGTPTSRPESGPSSAV